jgi:predicted porin
MRRTARALAVLAASTTSAAFAEEGLQIYGKVYPFVIEERGTGASSVGTPVSTLSPAATGAVGLRGQHGLASGNSRIGFRGSEDLGDGTTAFFQFEGQVGLDDSSGSLFSRDTFVGIQNVFGTVRLGSMDTVFKNYGDTLGFLGISSGTFLSSSDLLRKTGFGTSSSSSFHLRRNNSIVYETPVLYDFQIGGQYSTNETKTDTRDARVVSLGVKWENGPFYVSLAHEIHYDLFGGSLNAPTSRRNDADQAVRSRDKATQIDIEYRMNQTFKFEFDAIRKDYKENASINGRFLRYKNMAYLFVVDAKVTEQWRTDFHVVKSQAGSCTLVNTACSTDGLNAIKYAIGASYSFSRRTYLWSAISTIKNGKSARFNNAVQINGPSPGEDISEVALGINHSF